MQAAIVRFVTGYRGPRVNPVTTKQVLTHFKGTPRDFVAEALRAVSEDGRVTHGWRSDRSSRRASGVLVYEVPSTD